MHSSEVEEYKLLNSTQQNTVFTAVDSAMFSSTCSLLLLEHPSLRTSVLVYPLGTTIVNFIEMKQTMIFRTDLECVMETDT